jgi:hypothetical protein
MSNHSRFAVVLILAFAAVCLIPGCTTEKVDGDTTVFSFVLWVPLIVLLAGVIAFFAGVLMRRNSARWGWGLMIFGPILCLLLAPGLFLDKATVNQDRFTLRTGFWFAPTIHDVRFADLSGIDLIAEERASRRGRRTSYFLLCHRKSGQSEKVPVGDLMKRGAAAKILETAKQLGVPIADHS